MVNNVFAQIGLVMLIGLAAKNAILIVEFARLEYEKGKPLIEAALTGARLRLRPILMTSFAFIFGSLPLWFATGAGAVSRRILGTVVIGGMLAATCIAVCLIPVTFYVVEKLARSRKEPRPETAVRPDRPGARGRRGMSRSVKSEVRSPKSERRPKGDGCRVTSWRGLPVTRHSSLFGAGLLLWVAGLFAGAPSAPITSGRPSIRLLFFGVTSSPRPIVRRSDLVAGLSGATLAGVDSRGLHQQLRSAHCRDAGRAGPRGRHAGALTVRSQRGL